jgi:hypothetical protein
MLAMCRQLGFDIAPDPCDPDIYLVAIERGTAGYDGGDPSAVGVETKVPFGIRGTLDLVMDVRRLRPRSGRHVGWQELFSASR